MASFLASGAGAADGLEVLLARLMREQQVAQQAKVQDAGISHQGASLAETVRSHQAEEGLRGRAIDDSAANRALAREQSAARDSELEQNRVRDDVRARESLRAPGTDVSPQEFGQVQRMGVLPLSSYQESAGDFPDQTTTTVPLPKIKFKGTGPQLMQQQKEDNDVAQAAAREAGVEDRFSRSQERMHSEFLAKQEAEAAKPKNAGQTRTMKVVASDGPFKGQRVVKLLDAQGNTLHEELDQLPSGMEKAEKTDMSTLEMVKEIQDFGGKTAWKGTGGYGNLLKGELPAGGKSFMKSQFGVGDNTESTLRDMLGSLKADVAHEKYGSAFTETERRMLANFAPGADMDGTEIENRLRTMSQAIERRLAARRSGKPDTAIIPLLQQMGADKGGGAPGAGPTLSPPASPAGGGMGLDQELEYDPATKKFKPRR